MKNSSSRRTRLTALIIAAVSTAAMAGCAGTSSGGSAHGQPAVNIKLSIGDPADSSVGLAATHFADEVNAKSSGKVKVTVIPNGTSFGGDQTAAVTRVENGSLDSVILSTSVYEAVNKKWNAISLPYLLNSTEQEIEYLNGAPGKELLDGLSAIHTKGLALLTRTAREVTNSKRPIRTPADLKGLKIRTPQNPLWVKFFSAVGASPTPMDFSEVFTGLQTGTIDGQENPIEVPASNKFYEVQKYLSMTNHMRDAYILAMSDKVWNSLDDKDQSILEAAAVDTAKFKTENDAKLEKTQIKELESKGMKVNELTPDGQKQFEQIAHSLYPQFASAVGGQEWLTKTEDFVASLNQK